MSVEASAPGIRLLVTMHRGARREVDLGAKTPWPAGKWKVEGLDPVSGKTSASMAQAMKARGKIGPRSGFVKATFSLQPEQLAALVTEAQKRARPGRDPRRRKRGGARGARRVDEAEAVRESPGSHLTPNPR